MKGDALNRQRNLESFSDKVNRALCCCFSDSRAIHDSDVVRTAPRGGTAESHPRAAHSGGQGVPKGRENVDPNAWWLSKVSPGNASASYEYARVLGRGASSVVREGVSRKTGEKFACKIVPLKGRTEAQRAKQRDAALREVEVWSSVNHPGIVNLIEFFVEPTSVVIVMELCRGSTLLDEVLERGGYSVQEAQFILKQVLEAVRYLHATGVVHRDIKLENLLLRKRRDLSSVKLADMGFAVRLDTSGHYRSMAGTPAYLAPEVIKVIEGRPGASRAFTGATDMWSAGVAFYLLLGGYPPFDADTTKEVFRRVLTEEVKFDTPVWETVASSARQLILRLLNDNPMQRYTAAKALKDKFMTADLPVPQEGIDKNLQASFNNLQKYLRTSTGKMGGNSGNHGSPQLDRSDSLEESLVPSKFLEMQVRHDASHGRHLNESLRKIFNRNANTKKQEPKQNGTKAPRQEVAELPRAIEAPPSEEGCQEPGLSEAVQQEQLEGRTSDDATNRHHVVRDINSRTEKLRSSIFEIPNTIEAAPSGNERTSAVPHKQVAPPRAIGRNRVTPYA